MNKFVTLVKSKKGAALMSAIAFMTIAVALCGMITTFILAMANTSSSYTSVNENKIIADQIAEDYLDYKNDSSVILGYTDFSSYVSSTYTGYIVTEETDTCIACEEGSTAPLITIEVSNGGSGTYKFTKYEYGNI